MKQVCRILALVLLISLCLAGCQKGKYRQKDFIGLTAPQIVEKFGEFDFKPGEKPGDGLYRDCRCGYLVTKADYSFLGERYDEFFLIWFDENGVAYQCEYKQVA